MVRTRRQGVAFTVVVTVLVALGALPMLLILALSGQVAAHGANSYAIIVRSESVMPESADLIVNDTLVLYNPAGWQRSAIAART